MCPRPVVLSVDTCNTLSARWTAKSYRRARSATIPRGRLSGAAACMCMFGTLCNFFIPRPLLRCCSSTNDSADPEYASGTKPVPRPSALPMQSCAPVSRCPSRPAPSRVCPPHRGLRAVITVIKPGVSWCNCAQRMFALLLSRRHGLRTAAVRPSFEHPRRYYGQER